MNPSLAPSSRSSEGVDCERSSDAARSSSKQSLGLCPEASSISVASVFFRSSSAFTPEVYNARRRVDPLATGAV